MLKNPALLPEGAWAPHQVGTLCEMESPGLGPVPKFLQPACHVPVSTLLALIHLHSVKAMTCDASLVHGSLYIFINKTIMKGRA